MKNNNSNRNRNRNRNKWIAVMLAIAAAMLWGGGIPFGNILEHKMAGIPMGITLGHDVIKIIPQLTAFMYFGVAITSIPSLYFERVRPWQLNKKDLLYFGLCVICGSTVGPVCMLIAMLFSPVGSVSLWQNSDLFLTAIIARYFFRERLNIGTWAAIGIALIGASCLAVGPEAPGIFATIFIIISCLCWGIDNNTRVALKPSMGPYQLVFWKGLLSGIVNLSMGFLVFGWSPCSSQTIMSAALFGVFAIGLCTFIAIHASAQLGPTGSTIILGASPFIGLVASHFLLKEPITRAEIVAGILFCIAIAVLLCSSAKTEINNQPSVN